MGWWYVTKGPQDPQHPSCHFQIECCTATAAAGADSLSLLQLLLLLQLLSTLPQTGPSKRDVGLLQHKQGHNKMPVSSSVKLQCTVVQDSSTQGAMLSRALQHCCKQESIRSASVCHSTVSRPAPRRLALTRPKKGAQGRVSCKGLPSIGFNMHAVDMGAGGVQSNLKCSAGKPHDASHSCHTCMQPAGYSALSCCAGAASVGGPVTDCHHKPDFVVVLMANGTAGGMLDATPHHNHKPHVCGHGH
jgi:hypothetical protein